MSVPKTSLPNAAPPKVAVPDRMTPRDFLLYALMFVSIALVGFFIGIRPVLLPHIRESLGVDFSAIGVMLSVSNVGFFVAAFLGGVLSDRRSDRLIMVVGFAFMTVGLLLFGTISNLLILIVVMILLNIGSGSVDIAANAMGGRFFTTHAAIKMNLLHFFFGVGAAAAPWFATTLLLKEVSWNTIYVYCTPAALILLVLWMCFRVKPPAGDSSPLWETLKALMRKRVVWIISLLMASGLVAELSLQSWIKGFLIAERGMGEIETSGLISLFFIFFTVSRLVNGFFIERIGYARSVIVAGICGGACFVLALSNANLSIFFAISAYFSSIIFPTAILLIARHNPKNIATGMGVILSLGGIIHAICDVLIGMAHDAFGVYAGFSLIIVGYVGMICCAFALIAHKRKSLQ